MHLIVMASGWKFVIALDRIFVLGLHLIRGENAQRFPYVFVQETDISFATRIITFCELQYADVANYHNYGTI